MKKDLSKEALKKEASFWHNVKKVLKKDGVKKCHK
jgi:hypothetical protein